MLALTINLTRALGDVNCSLDVHPPRESSMAGACCAQTRGLCMMSHLVKRTVFAIFLALVVLVPIEIVAHALYFANYGAVYSPSQLAGHAERGSSPDLPRGDINEIAQRRILHPYLGYAIDRRETLGMAGDIDPVQKRAAGKFIVGVTGGSVANQVCSALDPALSDEFARSAKPLEVVVVCLTIDGFKQPQQLISINYLLSIGAEFDAVINVDGFNDIVLPIIDNYQRGIYPFYPRAWKSFVNRRPSQNTIVGAGEIAFLRGQQAERMKWAQSSLLGRSAITGLYSSQAIARDASRIAEIQQALIAETVDLPFEAQGPFEELDDVAQIYAASAEVWARSSVLMKGVLAQVDTAYFHVLQPNQYVRESKVFTEKEKTLIFAAEHPYAKFATRGYPYLFEASQTIVDANIAYLDATPIFKNVSQDVYGDACCHVNAFGKKLMAREISAWVVSRLNENDR